MSTLTFPQRKDVDLLTWSAGFLAKIAPSPGDVGLTAAQVDAFSALQSDFAARYAIARNPKTNSKANISNKNGARQRMLHGSGGAWEMVDIIQAHPGTTDSMRSELGLRISHKPSQVQRPGSAPKMSIVMMRGRMVTVRLGDAESPDRRGKPAGVLGATVLYWCGETPPSDACQWMFAMNTSRPEFDVEMPMSVPGGARVWLTAFWFNKRMQAGPLALEQHTRANAGADKLALAA